MLGQKMNKTEKLRVIARAFRANGFSRKDFIDHMVDWGFNRDTASTQWNRSQTQI